MSLAPIPRRHAVLAGVDNAMGALLAQIEPDTPASRAGLMPGDVVIKLDGIAIHGVDDLIRALDRDRIDRALENPSGRYSACCTDWNMATRSRIAGSGARA